MKCRYCAGNGMLADIERNEIEICERCEGSGVIDHICCFNDVRIYGLYCTSCGRKRVDEKDHI